MPPSDEQKPQNLDPKSLARVLNALKEAAEHLPAHVRQQAEKVIRLQAQAEFEDRLETALINRMLQDRHRRCPELESLLTRLTRPSATPGAAG